VSLEFKILMGYDDQGTVFDVDDFVLREVLPEFKDKALNIYNQYVKFNLKKNGIVDTSLASLYGPNYFKHKKHLITYPHEWTANMFKDVVLFHLDLFLDLDKFGLALKDAHPHNILFDDNTFVFVDFLSLSELNDLKTEQSLIEFAGSKEDPRFKDPRFIIFDEMFFPEFFVPLVLMYRKEYAKARHIVCYRGRNCEGKVPSWDDLDRDKIDKQYFLNLIENLKFKWFLKRKRKLVFKDFCTEVKRFIQDMNVTPPARIYDTYYKDKKENLSFEFSDDWKDKQKSVYRVIKEIKPKTVLDVGANTGWFSILAAKESARVVATDIEESSIDLLYSDLKKNDLNIIPLMLPFEDLTKEVFGAYDKRLDFKNPRKNPIFSKATKRLQSDMVLFLALMHHLVLGGIVDLKTMFNILSELTKKVLVLEYVGLDDHLVKLNPSSFTKNRDDYSLDKVIAKGKEFFKGVEILDSTPPTRKMLVFKK